MTMSCVADANATTVASTPNTSRCSTDRPSTSMSPPLGCTSAMPTRARPANSCDSSIQPRRRPNTRPSTGTSVLSTIGAHRNFIEYARPTQDRKPMVSSSMPSLRIQKPSVLPTR